MYFLLINCGIDFFICLSTQLAEVVRVDRKVGELFEYNSTLLECRNSAGEIMKFYESA
jgi:hypothetical protein